MKAAFRTLLLIAVYLPFLAAVPVDRETGPVPEFSGRINAFTFDFLRKEAAGGSQNAVVSPMSVYSGLAVSYVASGGETRRALAQAAHFPAENESLVRDLAGLRRELRKNKGVELRMADSVWLDTRYAEFRNGYLRDVDRMGAGGAREAHFIGDLDKACDSINAWVAAVTDGRITQALAPGDLPSRSHGDLIDEPALVGVDAVWFKGEWASQFEAQGTAKRKFYTTGGKEEETAMMHQSSVLLYSENARCKFLDMPYRGGEYSMMVLLPDENAGAQAMLAGLTPDAVVDLRRSALPRKVDVLFPKFTINHHSDAKGILMGMGAGVAFDKNKADFGAMIVKKPAAFRVYLSSVNHDAWMEVGEEGTEAAAVTTSVNYSIGCSAQEPPMPAEFHADHPFLFLIVHNKSRSIVFAGWIGNPAALAAK